MSIFVLWPHISLKYRIDLSWSFLFMNIFFIYYLLILKISFIRNHRITIAVKLLHGQEAGFKGLEIWLPYASCRWIEAPRILQTFHAINIIMQIVPSVVFQLFNSIIFFFPFIFSLKVPIFRLIPLLVNRIWTWLSHKSPEDKRWYRGCRFVNTSRFIPFKELNP